MVWTSHVDQIRVQFLPIAILPFGILPLVCAPDASGGGHRLPAVATRGVYPVPRLQPPHELPDGQHLNASVAQLAEHALRKRMVMGSIPIRGCMGRALPWRLCRAPNQNTHSNDEPPELPASCGIRTYDLPLTERVLYQLS